MKNCVLCGQPMRGGFVGVITHVSQLPPDACDSCIQRLPVIVADLKQQIADLKERINPSSAFPATDAYSAQGGSIK